MRARGCAGSPSAERGGWSVRCEEGKGMNNEALRILADATDWQINRDLTMLTVTIWRNGKKFKVERSLILTPTPEEIEGKMYEAIIGALRLIEHGVKS